MLEVLNQFHADKMVVQVYSDRQPMGQAAALAVAGRMRQLLALNEDGVSMLFAAAPSQSGFLTEISKAPGIDWKKVIAFHLDEYVGLLPTNSQSFVNYLKTRLFDRVKPGRVEFLDGMAKDPNAESERYAALLAKRPIDIACVGIGENGHLAFNDPHVADFKDPKKVKVVALDPACIQQQVNDGCFSHVSLVPKKALTVTIPTIMSATYVYCIVPGPRKAAAVKTALRGTISRACPATVLRTHANAMLFLDSESARLI